MKQKNINISNFKIGNNLPFTLIAGPCQLESRTHAFKMVEKIQKITKKLKINLGWAGFAYRWEDAPC